jgi:hypothetical protein
MDLASDEKEYAISVRTSSIRDAVSQLASALYDLLEQASMTADDEDESDFDRFARETLHVLARHPEQLSSDDLWSGMEPEDASDGSDAS